MKMLTVIIPNYNGKKHLDGCLRSLRRQSFKDFSVTVVDNGSEDGSAAFLREKFPEVRVIELSENTGFANAVNVGIKDSDSRYVFLLNNDTMCDEKAVESLVRVMEKKKKLFSAQAKLLQMKDPKKIDDSGDLYCALGWAFSPGRDQDAGKFSGREAITSACAGAAVYRRECFEEIGYFDEVHFCYLEDMDIGYRARLRGYVNVMEPTSIVYHDASASSGSRYNEFKVELTAGNNIYLIYKNMPIVQIFVNLPLIAAGIIIKHVFYSKRGLEKAHIRGLLAGLKKIAENYDKKVRFGAGEYINAFRLQIELWVNCARRILSI